MRWMVLLLALLVVPPSADASDSVRIEVVLSEKTLYVYRGEDAVRRYPVAIGTLEFPTPEGEYEVHELIWNPPWVPLPDREWTKGETRKEPGDPENPMRILKIPFDPPYYYVHGTSEPWSVGRLASHGCLRMRENDVADLGRLLMDEAGDPPDRFDDRVRRGETQVVRLRAPIALRITMGEGNVYPGVVWAVD